MCIGAETAAITTFTSISSASVVDCGVQRRLRRCILLSAACRAHLKEGDGRDHPEGKQEIKGLGFGESADEHKQEESDQGGSLGAVCNSPEPAPETCIDSHKHYDSHHAVRKELLKQFVLRVPCLEHLASKGRSDLPHGIEAVPGQGFTDGRVQRPGPDGCAPGKGLRLVSRSGVDPVISVEQAPEGNDQHDGAERDEQLLTAAQASVLQESVPLSHKECHERSFAEASKESQRQKRRRDPPSSVFPALKNAAQQNGECAEVSDLICVEVVQISEPKVFGCRHEPCDH